MTGHSEDDLVIELKRSAPVLGTAPAPGSNGPLVTRSVVPNDRVIGRPGKAESMRRGPLAESYLGSVALVGFSLIPYLAMTGAVLPLASMIAKGVGLTPHAMDLTIGLSTGAYAVGTVLAVQLGVRFPPRRLLVCYEALFVAASVAAAWAPSGPVFAGAFVAQGLCTSLMLIAAVPPLVTGWPAGKMPTTGVTMNLCIFGAVAVGPTVGALLAGAHQWRPLFVVVALLGVCAAAFSLLTFEDDPVPAEDAPWDLSAVALAVVGCAAAFFGAGWLEVSGGVSAGPAVLLVVGISLLLALVTYQYRSRDPLMPVKAVATSMPTVGICIALSASAAAIGIMELVLQALSKSGSPGHVAVVFLPEFGGAIVMAAIFGLVFRTPFTPVLALGGLLLIIASAAIFITSLRSAPLTSLGAGLLGLGVAASVSPALFMVGFSLRSSMLQRVFALVELLRGVTGFLVAPVLLFISVAVAATPAAGTTVALWICLGMAAAGFTAGVTLYLTGKGVLEPPDLVRWQKEEKPAWRSPPTFERIRSRCSGGTLRPRPITDAPATGPSREIQGS